MAFKLPSRTLWQSASKLTSLPRVTSQAPSFIRTYATPPSSDQQNKTAIVTGSSRGIGKAIAFQLARDGYDICINDIKANEAGSKEAVAEIKGMGRNAFAYSADVSKLDEVTGMVEASVQELGPLNTMIANAGIAQVKQLLDLTEQDLKRMFEVNGM
jgi:NAD(P)-dependent dehydrogenase (short-subunit alcohol dehydrogenase family)